MAASGWENPYTGWLDEEIQTVQKEALATLIERDFVRMASDNEIALDENIAKIFATCARPDFSILVAVSKSRKKPAQSMIHSKDGVILEHVVKKDKHAIRQYADWDEVFVGISSAITAKTPSSKVKDTSFRISENTFAECEALLKKKNSAEAKILLNAEIKDPRLSQTLLDVLDKPLLRAAIIVVPGAGINGAGSRSGVAVYQTESRTWLLEPLERAGRQFINFKPGDRKSIDAELKRLLPVNA